MSAEAERWRQARFDVVNAADAGAEQRELERRLAETVKAGDALDAALEAERAPVEFEGFTFPDKGSLIAHLVRQRDVTRWKVEARDRRIAEVEAGLRRIAEYDGPDQPSAVGWLRQIARDLLAGRAAGGEG